MTTNIRNERQGAKNLLKIIFINDSILRLVTKVGDCVCVWAMRGGQQRTGYLLTRANLNIGEIKWPLIVTTLLLSPYIMNSDYLKRS